ncbi:hypothetical protein [Octadecabacter ascidiaceicola]|uniref:Uncharacterized protein n=1 Tax=Octadecabacter ascidiaceicola TaxID=1655543 RepID=A0A238JR79_9RHOB|nr:hypothetical protein [Octadecabacter ascidiaceicola]SMX32372.1 hypothetical protein OCA8868_00719 [Octadecabacter ascidiaceicola]
MFGFLIAVLAGAATPMIEAPLARPVARMMGEGFDVKDTEMRALAFMIAMIIAGILCAVFSSGSALGLAVGGSVGYFAMRLLRTAQRMIEDKRS